MLFNHSKLHSLSFAPSRTLLFNKHCFLTRLGSNSLSFGFQLKHSWKSWSLHDLTEGAGDCEGPNSMVIKALTGTQRKQLCAGAEPDPVSGALEYHTVLWYWSTVYTAVSLFGLKGTFGREDWSMPHILTIKGLENKRRNMKSAEKRTTKGAQLNHFSTCRVTQGSAHSADRKSVV